MPPTPLHTCIIPLFELSRTWQAQEAYGSRVLAMGEICYWAGLRHDPATHHQVPYPSGLAVFLAWVGHRFHHKHSQTTEKQPFMTSKPEFPGQTCVLGASPIRSTPDRCPRSALIEGTRLAIAPNPPSSKTRWVQPYVCPLLQTRSNTITNHQQARFSSTNLLWTVSPVRPIPDRPHRLPLIGHSRLFNRTKLAQ